MVFAGVLAAAAVVHVCWNFGSSAAVLVAGVTASLAVASGVRAYQPPHRGAWWLLAAAVVVNATARVVYVELPGAPGTLSWNWIVWSLHVLTLLLLVTGGLWLASSTLRSVSAAIDIAIILLGAGLLAGVLIAVPYADRPGLGDLWRTVRIGYVFRDVLVLALVIHLATAVRWSRSLAWLVMGLSGLVVYDVLFRLGRIRGESVAGTPIDLVWMLFFAGVAFAALSRSMATFDTPAATGSQLPPLRVALVAVAALIPSGVLLLGLLQRPPWYQPLIIGAATMIVVLALARIVDVGVQLHRHITGERALREAVTELAELRDMSAIAPVLERVVARLLGETARCRVAVEAQPAGWADEIARRSPDDGHGRRQAEFVVPVRASSAAPTGDRRSVASATPAATASVGTAGSAGSLRLVVDGDRASLGGMKPRLEVLATQAGFALERIRLNNDSIRHASESYFRTLVHNSTDVILIVNDDDTIRYASPSASAVFGSSKLIGIAIPDLVAETHRATARQMLRNTRDHRTVAAAGSAPSTQVTTADWAINRGAGAPALVEVSCRDLRGETTIGGLVVTMRDVTRQRLLERELEYRAYHDPLTGLANRLPFTQRLNRLTDQPRDQGDLGAVLYADIDDLKIVNDALGHDAGDVMLVAVADRLRQLAGEYGPHQTLAARLSGDEFAVQIDHVADEDAAGQAAQRLVELLGRPVNLAGQEVGCSASVGVATTADAVTGPDLLRNADLALYASKRIGKGHWRDYDPSM
ncbi:MAG TPA: sensor domain-containing diguanylate cyclase, partial [Micromonosporaceae bacterium]